MKTKIIFMLLPFLFFSHFVYANPFYRVVYFLTEEKEVATVCRTPSSVGGPSFAITLENNCWREFKTVIEDYEKDFTTIEEALEFIKKYKDVKVYKVEEIETKNIATFQKRKCSTSTYSEGGIYWDEQGECQP